MLKKKRKAYGYKNAPINNNSNLDSLTHNQKREFKKLIRKQNPDLFHFVKSNSFIYEPLHSSFFYSKLSNKNSMKLNKEEILFLENLINSFDNSLIISPIYVLPFFKELVGCIIPCKCNLSKRANVINQIIMENQKYSQISVNKVTQKYNEYASINNQKTLQKSSIYNIMKKELHYRYIKTTIKSSKLLSNEYIKYCFFLLKQLLGH